MSGFRQTPIFSRQLFIGLLAITFCFPAGSNPVSMSPTDTATQLVERTHIQNTNLANQLLYNWHSKEIHDYRNYLTQRGLPGGPSEDLDIQIDTKKVPLAKPTIEDMKRDAETEELARQYYEHQGHKRYIGIFLESGAAHSNGYQWNTQRWAGLAVKELRDRFLDAALENDILNIRLGVNIHDLDPRRPQTLEPLLDFHREAWKRGISITDSILFFPGLKVLETLGADGKVDPLKSYNNHPHFPQYAEKMADFILPTLWKEAEQFNAANAKLPIEQRKPEAKIAINKVNEPETDLGFRLLFWNLGHAQGWSDMNEMRRYIDGAINLADASVGIGMAAERAAKGRRTLYFHNEAMTPQNYPSHKGDLQFLISKLILGDKQLMQADYDALLSEPLEQTRTRFEKNKARGTVNAVEAAIVMYASIPANNTPQKVETARRYIIERFRHLKNRHLAFEKMTEVRKNGRLIHPGKNAKTDTIVMFDYYQQSEFILPKPVPEIIKSFAAQNGKKLKEVLMAKDDLGFLNVLRERTRQAEAATGQKLWHDYTDRQEINFEKFLAQEDGIILDKLIGLRNEWNLRNDEVYLERRARAEFDPNELHRTDEKRIDFFLDHLLKDEARLLKAALLVKSSREVLSELAKQGFDTSPGDLREILNRHERAALHAFFGLDRQRRTGFLPPHYARQTRAELRKGFYETFLTYVNELGVRIGGIGESGTPYYPWAATVHKQMMLSLVAAAKAAKFYIVRYDLGPGVGTIGWMDGPMTGNIQNNKRRGEDGIFKLVRKGTHHFEYQLSAWVNSRPWFTMFKEEFLNGLSQAEMTQTQQRLQCKTLFKSYH